MLNTKASHSEVTQYLKELNTARLRRIEELETINKQLVDELARISEQSNNIARAHNDLLVKHNRLNIAFAEVEEYCKQLEKKHFPTPHRQLAQVKLSVIPTEWNLAEKENYQRKPHGI